MVSAILHETGRIGGRIGACLLLVACAITTPANASPLFDEDAVLEVRLSGPLSTISRSKEDTERVEHSFVLTVAGEEIPVEVRVRGRSRTVVCSFPPLRLNFSSRTTAGTVFEGQDKLKLVTHCRSGREKFENNLLEEYTAYRIFNLISNVSYRVRLLRVSYEDSLGKSRNLDQPYFGFLIESDKGLAARIDGEVAKLEGVPYSQLNEEQTARLYVFQYLIANFDWSFVMADDANGCCHNIDLISRNDELLAVPYDFDFSGLVNASYTTVPESVGIRRATQRVYRGYCKLDADKVAVAFDEVVALGDEIMELVANSPVTGNEDTESRVRFIGYFFEKAREDRDDILEEFDSDCLGPH